MVVATVIAATETGRIIAPIKKRGWEECGLDLNEECSMMGAAISDV